MGNSIPSIHNNIVLCFSINFLSKLMLFYFKVMLDNNDDDDDNNNDFDYDFK